MKLFLKTTEKSTVLGVFRVDQAEYGIITIEKKFLCVLFETWKKSLLVLTTNGFQCCHKGNITQILFIYMLLWLSMFSFFLLEEDEVISFYI